jgi:cytochrome b involved in lipid metabolism
MSGSKHIKFECMDEVRAYAEREGKTLLLHNGLILDVSTFQDHHPGGQLLMNNYHLKNVEDKMSFHQPLSSFLAESMAIGSFDRDIDRLVDPNRCLGDQIW